jgi:hypothetical protein
VERGGEKAKSKTREGKNKQKREKLKIIREERQGKRVVKAVYF